MAVEWFVLQGSEEQGPISSSHLKLMADQRQITPETLIRQGAWGQWIAAGTIEDLFAVYEHAKPAPTTGAPPVRPSTEPRQPATQVAASQAGIAQQTISKPAPQPELHRQPVPQSATVAHHRAPTQPAPTQRPSAAPQATAAQQPAPGPSPTAALQPAAAQAPAPQPEDQNAAWFVQSPDGHQYGPAVKAQLDAWVQEGRVLETCLLWHAGWDQWRWAATVYPQLARAAFVSAPSGPAQPTAGPASAPAGPTAPAGPAAPAAPAAQSPPGREAQAPAAPGSPTPARPAVPQSTQPTAGRDPFIGQTLGRFEVRELIARGALGAVYKARQPALDRLIAVRVLPGVPDPRRAEQLRRELRAAAALNHPNIVEVHDMGEDRGSVFVAMELVEGGSLADLVRRSGRVPVARGLEIMKQAAAALAVAHAAGVVHRDVKPSNILLSPKGLAKLADFGLALPSETQLAATSGPVPSSAFYVSPEVVRGQAADTRSDLYSLGATFYHALAGRPPVEGKTGAEVLWRHVEAQILPIAQTAPNLPPSLCRVIDRLLAKDPAARYQTPGELLAALNQVAIPQAVPQAAQPGSPQPAGTAPAAAESDATQKSNSGLILVLGAVTAGVVFLVIVATLVYVLWLRGPGDVTPSPEEGEPPPVAAPAQGGG